MEFHIYGILLKTAFISVNMITITILHLKYELGIK